MAWRGGRVVPTPKADCDFSSLYPQRCSMWRRGGGRSHDQCFQPKRKKKIAFLFGGVKPRLIIKPAPTPHGGGGCLDGASNKPKMSLFHASNDFGAPFLGLVFTRF